MINRSKFSIIALVATATLALSGCSSTQRQTTVAGAHAVRDNCCQLLYQLLDQQKDLKKVLIISRKRPMLDQLIEQISDASEKGAKRLETFAQSDAAMALKAQSLPPGEVATRKAIENTRTRALVAATGDDFDSELLLSQAEALTYAWHLAAVAGANEPDPNRAAYFNSLAEEMKKLHARVVVVIHAARPKTKT